MTQFKFGDRVQIAKDVDFSESPDDERVELERWRDNGTVGIVESPLLRRHAGEPVQSTSVPVFFPGAPSSYWLSESEIVPDALESELERLRKERDALLAALEPFAEIQTGFQSMAPAWPHDWVEVWMSQFRAHEDIVDAFEAAAKVYAAVAPNPQPE